MTKFAAAALILLAGCTANIVGGGSPTPSGSAAPPSQGYEDLASTLFSDPGPGFVVVPAETKSLTVDEAVAGDDDPQIQRDRLLTHGYTRGFIRTWSSDDDSETVLYALVYEFFDAGGARADMQSGIDQAKKDGDATFAVEDIPGATGIKHVPKPGTEANDSVFFAVVFTRGNRYYLLTLGGPTVKSADQAVTIAKKMNAAVSRPSPSPSP